LKVLLGTPAYGGKIHVDYFNTVIGFYRVGGVQLTVMHIGNESLIQRARNKLITFFIEGDFDYLFFLDADVALPPTALSRLLSHQLDIVGVPVPLKGFVNNKPVYNIGKILGVKENGLLKVEYIGTAALLISRNVAEKIKVAYKDKRYSHYLTYYRGFDENKNLPTNDLKIYDVFVPRREGDILLSEDFAFCKDMQKLGFDVYADALIPARHCGDFYFEGCYWNDYLQDLEKKEL